MTTSSAPSIPATGTWDIDTVHSTANLTVEHNIVATFHAPLLGITGSLEDGVLSGSVPADGIQIGLSVFKEHVLGEGFLDAANHPTLSFKSHDIHAHEDGTVHLNGELTIKGVTKPISAGGTVTGPMEITRANNMTAEVLGLTLVTTFDRREFGLEIHSGTGWEVTLEVALELAKA